MGPVISGSVVGGIILLLILAGSSIQGSCQQRADAEAWRIQEERDRELAAGKVERERFKALADASERRALKLETVNEAQDAIIKKAGRDQKAALADIERIEREHDQEMASVPEYRNLSADEQRNRLREKFRESGRLP